MRTKVPGASAIATEKTRASLGAERRWSMRQEQAASAVVHCSQRSSMSCRLVDISMSGVRFELESDEWMSPVTKTNGLPSAFRLEIAVLGIEVDCQVAWRRKAMVGARFIGRIRPLPRQFRKSRNFGIA